MFLVIEDNPNCPQEERMFSTSGSERRVARLQLEKPEGGTAWCDVTGVEEGGKDFPPARAVQIEDSSAGSAWLVFGGTWGLRCRSAGSTQGWSLNAPHQWGLPFIVLDISGTDIQFDDKRPT